MIMTIARELVRCMKRENRALRKGSEKKGTEANRSWFCGEKLGQTNDRERGKRIARKSN